MAGRADLGADTGGMIGALGWLPPASRPSRCHRCRSWRAASFKHVTQRIHHVVGLGQFRDPAATPAGSSRCVPQTHATPHTSDLCCGIARHWTRRRNRPPCGATHRAVAHRHEAQRSSRGRHQPLRHSLHCRRRQPASARSRRASKPMPSPADAVLRETRGRANQPNQVDTPACARAGYAPPSPEYSPPTGHCQWQYCDFERPLDTFQGTF